MLIEFSHYFIESIEIRNRNHDQQLHILLSLFLQIFNDSKSELVAEED